MRLVLREYLSMLRESGELDALLPDLLLAMGIGPLTRPGRGIRQFGVDVPAVGIDPDDGRVKLFLLTIKRGNLTRADWDGSPQAIRPSLNEILDSYLQNWVRPEHTGLPKKIILATGGELRQEVEQNWRDYTAANRNRYPQYGEIEFDFWGGDKLSLFIERYFLDEYLFPESAQKALRKTIALADQNEDEPRHFYALVEELLFRLGLPTERTGAAERQRQKAFRLLNLSLNIVSHWCADVGNLRPSVLAAEHAVLRAWDWMAEQQLLGCEVTRREFERLFASYLSAAQAYAEKLRPFCLVRDGLFGWGHDDLEYPLRTFEVMGILGSLAMNLVYVSTVTEDEEEQAAHIQTAVSVADTLRSLVSNNPSAWTPRYDEHAIDIALGLLALTTLGYTSAAEAWVKQLGDRVVMAYRMGRYFPIASDSYDDLVALHGSTEVVEAALKQKLMQLSTVLPLIAEWYVILGMEEAYALFCRSVAEFLAEINLQLWQPDDTTDQHLYRANAGYQSGYSVTSIKLPGRPEELALHMVASRTQEGALDGLSCVREGWPGLGLISSRHFRTPVVPAYWREALQMPESTEPSLEAVDAGAI